MLSGWKDHEVVGVFSRMEQRYQTSDVLVAASVTPSSTAGIGVIALRAAAIAQAPSTEATDVLVLANGTRLRIRPIGPEDSDGLAALFARMGPESRRRRYLSPKRDLTPRELAYLTDIDHVHHEAFAAIDHRDGSIVGVGRYARHAGRPSAADVAVEVVDELQDMGIGTALTRRVVESARANGFALLTATTLWENRPARALLRRLEFHACGSDGGEIELQLRLDRQGD